MPPLSVGFGNIVELKYTVLERKYGILGDAVSVELVPDFVYRCRLAVYDWHY